MALRFLTAGESHGPGLTVIIDGLPAGVPVVPASIQREMRRRMGGYGRGGRMQIETDAVEIAGGVRFERTLGSPVALLVRNRDFENWRMAMDPFLPGSGKSRDKKVTNPRPGHGDLAGLIKYEHEDVRNILERASARSTAARVAIGAIC